jgi:glucose-6-phosphate 1-dehydrogenase
MTAGTAAERGASSCAPPAVLVIFGATGDLTSRMLMPAMAALAGRGELAPEFTVVGVGRSELADDEFATRMGEAGDASGDSGWRERAKSFRYIAGDYEQDATYRQLVAVLAEVDEQEGTAGNRVFYLATPPSGFGVIVDALGAHGLNRPADEKAFVRVVMEKPFGHDLDSAVALQRRVEAAFDESQVYRIDHFLGKEAVQNLLALRFANAIFEPVWNRRYVDHVQVTVAESLGVGHRGGFYEEAGALRDMVQNHVMQVLALVLMEPPVTMDPEGIRDEKVKALRAVDVLSADEVTTDVVRARYEAGWVAGEQVPGYRDEDDVDPRSQTETFVAMRLGIDNWRWAGVPIYLRTGKRLAARLTEVSLHFRPAPHLPFADVQTRGLESNTLVLRIEPDEGVTLSFAAKVPGPSFDLRSAAMDFRYRAGFEDKSPDAYERLLYDVLCGDPTLFLRRDEVEQAWRIVAPVLESWGNEAVILARYPAGAWGPREADELLLRDGRQWRMA